jgi:hypothetical protein
MKKKEGNVTPESNDEKGPRKVAKAVASAFIAIAKAGSKLIDKLAMLRAETRADGFDDYALCKLYGIPKGMETGSNVKVPFASEALRLTQNASKAKKEPTVPDFSKVGTVNNMRDALALARHKDPSTVKGPADLTPAFALECLKLVKAGTLAPSKGSGAGATALESVRAEIANHGNGESEEAWTLDDLQGIADLVEHHITERTEKDA